MEQGVTVEWRADAAHWRWLLLGALGLTASSCGGRAGDDEPEASGASGTPGRGGASSQGLTGGGSTSGVQRPVSGGTIPPAPAGVGGVTRPPAHLLCGAPSSDLGGNWERCANGIVHRRELGVCPSSLPRSPPSGPSMPDDTFGASDIDASAPQDGDPEPINPDPSSADLCEFAECCSNDSDCTAAPHGFCARGEGGEIPVPTCRYGCVSDDECDDGYVCLCGDLIGACVSASCRVDADCGGSLACAPHAPYPGCPGVAFACQSTSDSCASDADCADGTQCSLQADSGARSCQPMSCTVGRPFLVAGRARLAASIERSDWYAEGSARALERSSDGTWPRQREDELRAAARQGWLDQALMEHASVAAFARFSLELLSLGAPAELARASASAMLDEIGHARECFSLARRYSDRDQGPGPLPLTGALGQRDLASIVVAAIEEGCIGETIAALEAAEALAHCSEPEARRVLEQISRDETQHAHLAWRFVAWALAGAPESVCQAAQRAFRGELEREAPADGAPPTEFERELLRCGLVPREMRERLRWRVAREVVGPCAEALFRALDAGAQPDRLSIFPGFERRVDGAVC